MAPDWWVSGEEGKLPPNEQAKLWALVTMSARFGLKLSPNKMKDVVKKVGGGSPCERAVQLWVQTFKEDPDWYPGKTREDAEKRRPKPTFTVQKQLAVARAAEAEKRAGNEPTVAAVRLRAPKATLNPKTGQPYGDKYILQVFRTRCFDEGASLPWGHLVPHCKTALSPAMQELRFDWSKAQIKAGHPDHWFWQNVVWMDPCSTVLSETDRAAFDEKQASYGRNGKRWGSPDARASSRMLRASPYATKQCQWGDERVWWFVVLFRGFVRFVVMPDSFTQTGAGVAMFVDGLEKVLKKSLGNTTPLPRIVFTDRGPGLYQGSTGHIVKKYNDALKRNGFRPYAGCDASNQPSDIADCLPHETAVAWARNYLKKRPLDKKRGLEDMREQLVDVLADAENHVNSNYNVEKLCKGTSNERMRKLRKKEGDRLRT